VRIFFWRSMAKVPSALLNNSLSLEPPSRTVAGALWTVLWD
jgi:hypothetical protein